MFDKKQNACLMVTGINDEEDKAKIIYIPIHMDMKTFKLCVRRGRCENKHAVSFNLEETEEEFWSSMWEELMQDTSN